VEHLIPQKISREHNLTSENFGEDIIYSLGNITLLEAPYQQVLSHGFVVDEKGRKMSKSLGNVIDPEDILTHFVISCDFTKEIKISISILENLRENYRKIRNTFRFLLGNLANLPPELQKETDLTSQFNLVDYYLLHQLEKLLADNQRNYNEYNFNPIYSSLLNFCINDLSTFYFEISKDSLYCDSLTSPRRNQEKKIQLITEHFFPLRNDIYQLLEKARQKNIITTNSQASLLIHIPREKNPPPEFFQLSLTELLMVAEIRFTPKLKKDMMTGNFCSLYLENTQLK
ncbi:17322_t:CDS:2, partial [Racocetra fulgida]